MTKITVKGKEYILRFDMGVSEWMENRFGNVKDAMVSIRKPGKSREALTEMFTAMANAANDYLGTGVVYKAADVQLFDRHTSMGRVAVIVRAIEEAIRDGNRMQASDEDDDNEVRDDYLEEVKKIEAEKN